MSSIASKSQPNPHVPSYGGTDDWMHCFELSGHGGLSPDEAITQANQAILDTGQLCWTMPLARLVDEEKKIHALEALQRSGVEQACGQMAYYHTLVGWLQDRCLVHQLACQVYQRALDIEPIAMTLFTT